MLWQKRLTMVYKYTFLHNVPFLGRVPLWITVEAVVVVVAELLLLLMLFFSISVLVGRLTSKLFLL